MDWLIHLPTGTLLADRRSVTPWSNLRITSRNKLLSRVFFLEDSPSVSGGPVVTDIPSPYTHIVISGRRGDNFSGDLLFFLELGPENKTGAADTLHHAGTLNTLTAAAAALFTATDRASYPIKIDVDLLVTADPADGRNTIIKQAEASLLRPMWQGDENIPESDDPSYPLPGQIFTTADLVTAEIDEGEAVVDFDISALGLDEAPGLVLPAGVQKPAADADNIGILCAMAIDENTLRAWLTAAPAAAGYKAHIFFRS